MTNWTAVWRTADGFLESVGTVISSPLPTGLSSTDLGVPDTQPDPSSGKVWDATNHVFVASTLRSVLSPKQFWDRLTPTERESISNAYMTGTQTVKNKVDAFRNYVHDAGLVDCNESYIQAAVNALETAGIIAAGRAAQILA